MTPQPYFPEPITVPGNVASTKHRVRVGFVRRVVGGYFASTVLVAGAAAMPADPHNWRLIAVLVLLGLVALTAQRRALNTGFKDNALSLALLLPTLFWTGRLLRILDGWGWPVVALAVVAVGFSLYALLCGNDFSHIGQFVLVAAFSVICLVGLKAAGLLTTAQVWSGLGLALVYLLFLVYDLSMLVKRRKLGEEVAAVADLYRDLLNFVTYSGRVYWHWRKFRFP